TERAAYMVDTNQGLTQTYNKLKDPKCDEARVLALRALHEEMDRAVLDAYDWTELPVPPFCPKTPDEQCALETFQDAVVDHLFVLNAERAAHEKRLGAAVPAKGRRGAIPNKATTPARAKEKPSGAQRGLFDNSAGDD